MRKQTKKNYNKSEKNIRQGQNDRSLPVSLENVTDPESCGRLGKPSLKGGVIPTTQGIG